MDQVSLVEGGTLSIPFSSNSDLPGCPIYTVIWDKISCEWEFLQLKKGENQWASQALVDVIPQAPGRAPRRQDPFGGRGSASICLPGPACRGREEEEGQGGQRMETKG